MKSKIISCFCLCALIFCLLAAYSGTVYAECSGCESGSHHTGSSGSCSPVNNCGTGKSCVTDCSTSGGACYYCATAYIVTPSAGAGGNLSPSTAQTVNSGSSTEFTVTPNSGYGISSVAGCNGTLSGNTYTTGTLTGNCTVTATFIQAFTVTPSAGTGGWIGPSTAQTVDLGSSTSFTVTPNSGYSISSVSGCNGTLVGNTYTTGAINGSCTVTATFAQNISGSSYCNTPSSLSTVVAPNILFVIDISGSMVWFPYSGQNMQPSFTNTYSSATTYEGYFTPTANYSYNSTGKYWQQTTSGTPAACPATYKASGFSNFPSTSSVYTGNCLNFYEMSKIDMVQWAVTGGSPITCTGTNNFNPSGCDVELWQNSGMGASGYVGSICTSNGCILGTSDGTQVLVPWTRINQSLAYQFEQLPVPPRMGVMFLNDNGVNPNGKVYIGDFTTGSNTISASYPFENLITAVNTVAPEGGTPTGPVFWDALNYFGQSTPQFGGFSVMTGSTDTTDEWRNPLYECNSSGSCVLTSCAKNFVILMTDGLWNTPSCSSGDSNTVTVGGVKYSKSDPAVPAYQMHKGFTNGPTGVSSNVSAVYTIGLFLSATGQSDADDGVLALENIAMYGSFNQTGYTWPAGTSGYPATKCTSAETTAQGCPSSPLAQGSGCTPLPAVSSDWSTGGNGLPDTFFDTSSAADIQSDIYNAVLDALRRAASGTAASLLTTSQGSGSILSQAVFYPQRQFGSTVIDWTSELQTLWYYLDPALQSSVIMENDNNTSTQDILNISGTAPPGDYVLNFRFDTTQLQTVVDRCTFDGSGNCSNTSGSYINTANIGNVDALWQAGSLLWARNAVSSPRTIYTTLDLKTLTSFTGFSPSPSSAVQSLLQASNAGSANNIINYVQGIDQTGFRNRTVTIGSANGVWKLGDIVDSTPKVEGASPLNQYNLQVPQGYGDTSYGQYIGSFDYLTRNTVYASANDGMLHAFELGTLNVSTANTVQKAILCDDTSGKGNCQGSLGSIAANLGSEQWAFIPNNALPYLTYMTNPNYCHLFYVDGPLYLFDASINKLANCQATNYYDCPKQTSIPGNQLALNETSWQSVLIGSMGMGGASTYSGASCNTVAGLTNQCVISPLANGGLSSYFALNVTEPLSPSLMWEFSNPALGFTMAGPAVVRISSTTVSGSNTVPVNTTNGHWFAIFASGPTGPIDSTSSQFLGRSDQDLQLFIVDLATGALLRTIDTGIPNAFAVSDFNSSVDTDRWNSNSSGFYQDNVFYVGYVKQCPSTNTSCTDTTWTNGGVLRVMTKENPDPNQWVVSKVIDDIGPVTTSVTKLQDTTNGNLWLYFGTGRFFFKTSSGIDDPTNQRDIYGIVEPCYNDSSKYVNTMDPACTSSVSSSALTNRTTDNSTAAAAPAPGWYINLALSSGTSLAERVITDPLASPNGVVYFTTFAPNSDLCAFGGSTYLWAVGYNTGTSGIDVTPPGSSTTQTKLVSSLMVGKALMQVSTGSVTQENLATAFASGRRSSAITGQPPKGQGLTVMINPQPIKQIMHIKER